MASKNRIRIAREVRVIAGHGKISVKLVLPPDLAIRLHALSLESDRDKSEIVEAAIKRYIADQLERDKHYV